MLTLARVEKKLGIPAAEWEGRCFEIASAIVDAKLVKGRAIYGHWLGPIAKGSIFYSRRHLGFCHHGWIELPNGNVLDPTRWTFEMVPPYLFEGPGTEYDEGGNLFREIIRRPVPPFKGPSILRLKGLPLAHVQECVGDKAGFDVGRMIWLANLPLNLLRPHEKAIYTAFVKAGEAAYIPIDNRRKVLGE